MNENYQSAYETPILDEFAKIDSGASHSSEHVLAVLSFAKQLGEAYARPERIAFANRMAPGVMARSEPAQTSLLCGHCWPALGSRAHHGACVGVDT